MLNNIKKIIYNEKELIKQNDAIENINRTNSLDDELKYIDLRIKILAEINNILKDTNKTFEEFYKSLEKEEIDFINNTLIYMKRNHRDVIDYSINISEKYSKFNILYKILLKENPEDIDLNELIINFIKYYFDEDYNQDRVFEIKLNCSMISEHTIKSCFRYITDRKTGENKIVGFYSSIYYKKIIKPFFENFIAIGNDESTLLKYDNDRGIYIKMLHEIDILISETFPDEIVNITNCRKQLKDEVFRRCIKKNADEINNDTNLINFQNGYYNIKEDKLIKHSPEILNTIQLKGNYNHNALEKFKGSLFEYYLESTFDKDIIPVVQEMIGYCISSHTEAQKMFILTGKGGNSKSQLAEIVGGLFEEQNLTNISLHQLSKQEYLYELATSAFNICADIDSEYIKNTGIIKTLTGGSKNESLMARTLYGKPFKINPKCKFMFSANDIPNSSDKNISWYSRILFIPFYKKFRNSKKEIKDIGHKIITNEFEIVAAWAIEGLKRLMKNDLKFSNSKSINKKMQEYKFQNDSVEHFINDYCIIDSNIDNYGSLKKEDKTFIPCAEFTEIYKIYCQEVNDKPLGGSKIRDALERHNTKTKNGTLFKGRYYEGIAWNKEYEEVLINYKNTSMKEKRIDGIPLLSATFSISGESIEKDFFDKDFSEDENINIIDEEKNDKKLISLKSGDINGNNIITKKYNLKTNNTSEVLGRIFINEKDIINIPPFEDNNVLQTCINNLTNKRFNKQIYAGKDYYSEISRIKQQKLI